MNIYTMPLSEMAKDTTKLPTEITDASAFMQRALVIFAAIPLIRNDKGISMDDTMKCIPAMLTTPNGEMARENVIGLVTLMYGLSRSSFIKNMKLDATLGSFTPLFMYAHKLYNDVQYEEWDKSDPTISFALGKFLANALEAAPSGKLTLSADEVRALRETALTYLSGQKAGMTDKATAFKMPKKLTLSRADEDIILLKPLTFMLLQTWICNAEVRKPNSMILDPWNWDSTPAAWDVVVERVKLPATPKLTQVEVKHNPWA